jgi:hypothetical protein
LRADLLADSLHAAAVADSARLANDSTRVAARDSLHALGDSLTKPPVGPNTLGAPQPTLGSQSTNGSTQLGQPTRRRGRARADRGADSAGHASCTLRHDPSRQAGQHAKVDGVSSARHDASHASVSLRAEWRQVTARVASQREHGFGHYWLDLEVPAEFGTPEPGQFVQILLMRARACCRDR